MPPDRSSAVPVRPAGATLPPLPGPRRPQAVPNAPVDAGHGAAETGRAPPHRQWSPTHRHRAAPPGPGPAPRSPDRASGGRTPFLLAPADRHPAEKPAPSHAPPPDADAP